MLDIIVRKKVEYDMSSAMSVGRILRMFHKATIQQAKGKLLGGGNPGTTGSAVNRCQASSVLKDSLDGQMRHSPAMMFVAVMAK